MFKSNFPANICWSWGRHQHVFSVTILRLPRRLQDVLKTFWKTKNCYAEDVLKTCLQDVLKTYLKDALKTLWREAKYLLGISISNKSKCVCNKSIFQKSISDNSKANPKCINQNPIISLFILCWSSSSISILRIKKFLMTGFVLWNQLNSNSRLQKRWNNKIEFLSNILHKYI